MTIEWNDNEGYSCGWLLSELIRQTNQNYQNLIVSLRSKNGQFTTLDYYLTQVDKSLSLLSQNEMLEAVEVPQDNSSVSITDTNSVNLE